MKSIHLDKEELALYTEIIVKSIKTRIDKTKVKGAVVALSGGIDSSLVVVLGNMAVGDRLLAVIMPEQNITPQEDIDDALQLVERLKIRHRLIEIDGAVSWFEDIISSDKIPEDERRYSIANVKPRVRMIINYLFANLENSIVLGTSNKTELLLGYGTKYGDMAADLYPIGDLYKTQVWQMAEYVGIPTDIIRKTPSAGLWKGQTDEEELGHTYRTIDNVLFALVEEELSVREVSELLDIPMDAVEDIYRRVIQSEHKRRPPTITRLSKMCLDKDWRYPVERY